jgi:Domain of Unknown Function (DUF350).
MSGIGQSGAFYVVVLLWVARVVIWTIICTLLAWLGIRVLDALTPRIRERERIGENSVSVGLFMGGFLILVGLVIHGVVTGPVVAGGGLLASLVDPRRLGLVAISFLVSLLLGIGLLHIMDKLTPRIPFVSVERNPIAVGIYVFGYLIFFGLIMHSALTMYLL